MALDFTQFLWTARKWGTAKELVRLASSRLVNQFEVNIGPPFFKAGRFKVTVPGPMQVNSPIRISQGAGPYTGKGSRADEAEMDSVNITAYASDPTTLQCYWNASGPIAGNFKFVYIARLA